MHEFSLAEQLIETVSDIAFQHQAVRVRTITLRVGALSCVHKPALQTAFTWASEGTPLEGTSLRFVDVPVTIHCDVCGTDKQLKGIQSMRCPDCGRPCGELVEGRELEVDTIEILTDDILEDDSFANDGDV